MVSSVPAQGLATLFGGLVALLAWAGPAAAVDCSGLGRPGSVTLLKALQSRPDGTTVPVRFCIRHGQVNEIDTLDADSRLLLRSVYDGMKALTNTTPARRQTCTFTYREYKGDPAVFRPGDDVDFVLVGEGCGPTVTYATRIRVGQASTRTLSGCPLEVLPVTRENIGPGGQRLALMVSTRLHWSLETGPVAGADGKPGPGVRTVVDAIGEPDEVERWCTRPES